MIARRREPKMKMILRLLTFRSMMQDWILIKIATAQNAIVVAAIPCIELVFTVASYDWGTGSVGGVVLGNPYPTAETSPVRANVTRQTKKDI